MHQNEFAQKSGGLGKSFAQQLSRLEEEQQKVRTDLAVRNAVQDAKRTKVGGEERRVRWSLGGDGDDGVGLSQRSAGLDGRESGTGAGEEQYLSCEHCGRSTTPLM